MSLETSNPVASAKSSATAAAGLTRRLPAVLCIAFALLTAFVPVWRSFYRIQITYNEGWNVYNAAKVAEHQFLYPSGYTWTTVNYPALSFFIVAQLSRITHEYLFTARVLSLLSLFACCLSVGAIVRRLTGKTQPALLAGFFCLALFSADATPYVGLDDPQMLAQAFFLAGFALYVYKREHVGYLGLTVFLFVIGGNIKHNLLEFPLAVFLDLLLVSKKRATQFCVFGVLLAIFSIRLNQRFGGPFFLSQMLAPRTYSWSHLFQNIVEVFAPILLPTFIAFAAALQMRHAPERRVIVILFVSALVIGTTFAGGAGVWINSFFGSLLATSILLGLFFSDPSGYLSRFPRLTSSPWMVCAIFGWLVIPWIICGNWRPIHAIKEAQTAQVRFDQEVAFLRAQPGPAICESLLRCYFAGKPYIYDPFNSARLIQAGELDSHQIVSSVSRREYGAIQLDDQLEHQIAKGASTQRFVQEMLGSIKENYVLGIEHQDCRIYLPKRQ